MVPPARRVVLVVNPTSGKGRALRLLPAVSAALRERGDAVDVRLSRDAADAQALMQQAVRTGVDILAVLGGDGMMHLAVNAVVAGYAAGAETALGVLPAGTGNDLARGLGLDPGRPLQAAAAVAAGRRRRVDLARVSTHHAGTHHLGTVLATGFDALVNRRANALARPRGSTRYAVATLVELRTFAPLAYRLVVDGQVRELEAMMIAVGNTSSYGGGMRICPDATPEDGLLDVTIVHPVGRAKLLQLLPQMYSGRFARDRCVEQLRGRRISLDGPGLLGYGDGEPLGPAPLAVEVVPDALTVCGG